jgi:hypothetical protein
MGSSNPIKQAARYNAKFTGDVWRHTPDVKAMAQAHGKAATLNKQIDATISREIEHDLPMHPELTASTPWLLAMGREAGAIIRRHTGATQNAELVAHEQKVLTNANITSPLWRGLVLRVFGVTIV